MDSVPLQPLQLYIFLAGFNQQMDFAVFRGLWLGFFLPLLLLKCQQVKPLDPTVVIKVLIASHHRRLQHLSWDPASPASPHWRSASAQDDGRAQVGVWFQVQRTPRPPSSRSGQPQH